jgi:hypothetical protein
MADAVLPRPCFQDAGREKPIGTGEVAVSEAATAGCVEKKSTEKI